MLPNTVHRTHTVRQLLFASIVLISGFSQNLFATEILRLATTTSTENSGLLEVLLPAFEKELDLQVQIIAVGTGKALRLGEQGDVDVVMVHAKSAEEKFVTAGFGIVRKSFMYNYFLIVGPQNDPAGVAKTASADAALRKIEHTQALFLSRGDDSGTHKRERAIWAAAGITPDGDWYREAGQGMGKVLQIASELGAYTLTDRGTWLKLRTNTQLAELFSSSPPLLNPYSIIAVNPARHAHVNINAADALIDWLVSPPAQSLINDYRIAGERAFNPLFLANQ